MDAGKAQQTMNNLMKIVLSHGEEQQMEIEKSAKQ